MQINSYAEICTILGLDHAVLVRFVEWLGWSDCAGKPEITRFEAIQDADGYDKAQMF